MIFNLREKYLIEQELRYNKIRDKHFLAYDKIFINRDCYLYESIINNIQRWEDNKLCSNYYINTWKQLIVNDKLYKEIILNKNHVLNKCMLQNSPLLGVEII